MFILTELAKLVCKHPPGEVQNVPTQDLVTVEQKRVLVEPDPQGKAIHRCPMYGATIKPCTITYKVDDGYSDLIRINDNKLCLDIVTGFTNGSPPGSVHYTVSFAGQTFVSEQP